MLHDGRGGGRSNAIEDEYEDTELQLGLPGGCRNANRKRHCFETMDLKLKLATSDLGLKESSPSFNYAFRDEKDPNPRSQVVGWPPVKSYRKNILAGQSEYAVEEVRHGTATLVKVSMDGAPYLRKLDLRMYNSYHELSIALSHLLHSFSMCSNRESKGMMYFMNEMKLIYHFNGSDFVATYEDKDGDWMLVGDVPWEMFVESCKRLRIIKGIET